MLNKDEVKHIAKLARIELKNHEVERYQKELSAILDFVGELSKADTAGVDPVRGPRQGRGSRLQRLASNGVEPIRQITGLESIFRKDEISNRIEVGLQYGTELIKQAPDYKDGYVVVPEVMKGK